MKTKAITTRCLEVLALAMIGEGVVGLLRPRSYFLFWKIGPHWLRRTTEFFAKHHETTRLLCLMEIGVGLRLALHELDTESA
jgi:hypothetical protein